MTEAAMEYMPSGKLEQNTTRDAIFSGSLSSLRSCEKGQSRYLKPSMASCHDYCKYGKKHDYEAASFDLRTFLKKKSREQNQVATPKGEEKRSKTISKPKIDVEPIKKNITPSAKSLLKSRESKQNEVKSPTLHDEKRRKVIKRRTWVRPESSQALNIIKSTNLLSPDFEADASVDSAIAKEITQSTVSEPTTPVALTASNSVDLSHASDADISGNAVESVLSEHISSLASAKPKQRAPSVRKVQTIINQNAPLPPKKGDVAVRPAIVLKTRTPLLRSISHVKSPWSLITRRNLEKKTTKKFGVVTSKPVNTLKTTRAPLLRSISTRRNPESLRSTNTSEKKSLHDEKRRKVIKRRTWVRPESPQALNILNSANLLSPDFEADTSVDSAIAKEITQSTVGEPTTPVALTASNSVDLSPASDADISGNAVESALSEHISSLASTKTKQRAPSVRKVQTIINQNAPLPPKKGDVAVRSAIVLKTRTPLLRSIAHVKSQWSLITRRNLEKKMTKKFGVVTSKPVNTLKKTRAPLLRSISTRRNPESLSTNTSEKKSLHDEKRRKVIKRRTWVRPESSQALNIINSTNLLSPDFEEDASVDSAIAKEITQSTVGEPTTPVALTASNSVDLSPSSDAGISGNAVESSLSKHISSLASAKSKQRAPSVRKVQTIINQNAPLPPKKSGIAVRPAIILKTITPLLRSISHLKSLRSLITRRNLEKKTTKKFVVVTSKPINTLKTTRAPLLRSVSTQRNPESLRSTNTSEKKILKPSRSIIADRKVPQPPPTSVSSLNPEKSRNVKRSNSMKILDHKTDDSKSVVNEGISREGNSSGAQRTWPLHPQNNTPAPYKLKFKQGKVLDLRCDSIGTRRLWFRLGKMSAENQNGDGFAQKRSFQKDVGASDTKVTDSEPQAVVLKHQDTEEEKKKDGQALFNRVIEETASKLVEERKSKVMALVGAFETVISLQESKPAAVLTV